MLKFWKKVRIGKLVSICSGRRHAWFHSNVGLLRKPHQSSIINRKSEIINVQTPSRR